MRIQQSSGEGRPSFSAQSLAVLIKAGWSPARRVPVEHYVCALRERSYPTFPRQIEFLSEFGGLALVRPRPGDPGSTDSLEFDPVVAREDLAVDLATRDFAPRAGAPLSPIGNSLNGYLTLFMTADGRVFGQVDDFLYAMGRSGEELIENFCNNVPPADVP